MNIILVIYVLGLIFNFGTIFGDAMYNNRTAKEICEFIALSFLSWLLFPIAYIYQAIVKKIGRKN